MISPGRRDVVQPAVEEQIRQQQVESEIARLREKEATEGKSEPDKPLLRKIATITTMDQPSGAGGGGAVAALVPPVPAPRRDSRATPVQKPVTASTAAAAGVAAPTLTASTPTIEGVKTRNPKLASMMAMIGSEEPKGGQLFAGQTMTPEVPRHKVTTIMSQTEAEIESREKNE